MTGGIGGGLSVRHLHAVRDGSPVLTDISLEVSPGEVLVVLGASGAGKTTLVRVVAGLASAESGQVLVDGLAIGVGDRHRREVGCAGPDWTLSPRMTVRAHLASPLRARRLPRMEIAQRVADAAALLRLGTVLDLPAAHLSRGERQRAALARALVADPKVLVLDDPLRRLEAAERYQLRQDLPRLLHRSGAACLHVTQDSREAMILGDRVAILIDGRVAQVDTPDAVHDTPASVAVARLIGDPPMNVLTCLPAGEGTVEAFGLRFACGSGECLLGVRPQDVAVLTVPHPRGLPVELLAATPLRERTLLLLRTRAGEELLASIGGPVPRAGAALWALADPGRTLLFDAASGLRIPLLEARATEVAA
jgi:multiple sugar transport system ATP-binding protein